MAPEALKKPAATEEARREVSKIRSIVTNAIEDGVRSASRTIRHGRYAAEDVVDQAVHNVRQRPFQAMGLVFAAGMLVGGCLCWMGFRREHTDQ